MLWQLDSSHQATLAQLWPGLADPGRGGRHLARSEHSKMLIRGSLKLPACSYEARWWLSMLKTCSKHASRTSFGSLWHLNKFVFAREVAQVQHFHFFSWRCALGARKSSSKPPWGSPEAPQGAPESGPGAPKGLPRRPWSTPEVHKAPHEHSKTPPALHTCPT